MKNKKTITSLIYDRALEIGFDTVGISKTNTSNQTSSNLENFISNNFHGEMTWMENNLYRRKKIKNLWVEAKTAIVVGLNYGPNKNPLLKNMYMQKGQISVYATRKDYHKVIKGKLKNLASYIVSLTSAKVKVFVDTAPIMEKPVAMEAGIGWQGKHTNLVSRKFGSWLFLGIILSNKEFHYSFPETDHCGKCSLCLNICPTNAFPKPYLLDARRCISYLTIEHKGHIDSEFRDSIGNRIFGCDDCLAICPWNKFAKTATKDFLKFNDKIEDITLKKLINLNEKDYKKLFANTPVRRIGHTRFIRNVLIAIGNSLDKSFTKILKNFICDENAVVRAMAIWALYKINLPVFLQLRNKYYSNEVDPYVKLEWKK